jgi:hypothetical protein
MSSGSWLEGGWFRYTIKKTAINSRSAETPPIIGRDALFSLVNWIERQRHHDRCITLEDLDVCTSDPAASADCSAESDGPAVPGDDTPRGGDAP